MSFLANLPDHILGNLVDRKALLAALTALVVVAMFRYLQMLLLLTISILAIGANLPSDLAAALGISQLALLVSLGALIAISLLNRVTKLLPTHKEDIAADIIDSRQTMLTAISKGDQATVLRLLLMNESVNFTLNGTTPLHMAAEKGYPEIVRILISHGADFRIKNDEGKTPLEIALAKRKFVQTQEILHNVSKPYFATSGQAENRRADAEIWQKQHGS
jgi:ankyrin repeat protein